MSELSIVSPVSNYNETGETILETNKKYKLVEWNAR